MNERELLELAAGAAGFTEFTWNTEPRARRPNGVASFWNPLTDDSDALRLADHLRMMIDITDTRVRVMAGALAHVTEIPYAQHDRAAINRLAIVMTAADVQRARESAK